MSASAIRFSNIAVGVCALVFAGVAVWRELRPATILPTEPSTAHYIADWQSLRSDNDRIGPENASVELIEFVDFECPYCALFAARVNALMQKYPGDVSLTFRHLPIAGHRFARSAATAYECAKEVGQMEQMYRVLFAGQDSLGLKGFTAYAAEAEVKDTVRFADCMKVVPDRVSSDAAIAAELGVNATPSVVVNGWLLSAPPSNERLEEIVQIARAGRKWTPPQGDTIGLTLATRAP